jgi:hypothetical protein
MAALLSRFDLRRRVLDIEAVLQLRSGVLQQPVAQGLRPDRTRCAVSAVSVVLIAQICTSCTTNSGNKAQISLHLVRIDFGWPRIEREIQ